MKLNLGCGYKKVVGFVGVDSNPLVYPDVVLDLNSKRWPWKRESIDEVFCSHVLEHLNEPLRALKQIHAMLVQNGALWIIAPYWSSPGAHSTLDHKNYWGWRSIDPLQTNYRIIHKRIVFPKIFRLLGLEILANSFPIIYEDFFANVFPAREIHFELKKT